VKLGGLTELASGIDALYLSGSADLPVAFLQDLADWRQQAEADSCPVPVDLLGEAFLVEPRSWGRYPFRLRHAYGLLGFTDSRHLPAIRIQPFAEHLHGVGAPAVLEWWRDLVEAITGTVHLAASRLDLHADFHGWGLDAREGESFLCRASRRDTHEDGNRFTGFEFGRRRTGTVAARIYDKTIEVERKGLAWWPLLWGEKFEPGERVLRVEFEFGRKGLRQFGIDGARKAIVSAPGLWVYGTERWLTHRLPGGDATASRWPISEQWCEVQRATLRSAAVGVSRIRAAKRAADLRSVMPGLAGYLSSYAALTGTGRVEETLAVLPGHLRDYGIWSGKTFEDRVERKRLGMA
jgi:hypothetical protein